MSADYNSLYNAAIKMLAAREHCAAELRVKLLRRSADKVLIESVVAALQEASYLDDERFAEVFIRQKAQAGKGPYIIRQQLMAKGVGAETIQTLLSNTDFDWFELASQAYQKKYREPVTDHADRAKRQRFLASRGFTMDTIAEVLQQCQ